MVGSLQNVEILRTGRWKGNKVVEFTVDDLDRIVENFETINQVSGFKPQVKLGHTDTQKYFGQKDGAPALGFISRVWREGETLLADFINLPETLLDLIRERRYNNVSVELFPKVDYEGKTFKDVLTAVALLGADLPAVKGLKELAASLFKDFEDFEIPFEGTAIEFTEQQEIEMPYSKEQVDELVDAAVAKANKQADEANKVALTEKDSEIARLTAERDEAVASAKAVKDELAAFGDKAKSEKIEAMVDAAIKAGKVLPKNKERTVALGHSMSGTIKFGETEEDGLKVFEDHLSDLPAGVKMGEDGNADAAKRQNFADAADEVHARALKVAKEHNKEYKEARNIVLSEDKDLANRYLSMGD